MYSLLLPILGINKKVALEKIGELERMMNNGQSSLTSTTNTPQPTPIQRGQVDDLARFRNGLNSFK